MQARKLLAAILAAGINTVAFAEKSPLSYTSVGVAYLTGQADSNVYSGYWVGASLAAGDVAYFLVQQNAITTEKNSSMASLTMTMKAQAIPWASAFTCPPPLAQTG